MYNEDVAEYDIKENVFFIVFALQQLISLVALQMFFSVFSSKIYIWKHLKICFKNGVMAVSAEQKAYRECLLTNLSEAFFMKLPRFNNTPTKYLPIE